MSVTIPAPSRSTDSDRRRRDLVTALLCTWLIGGLVLDGWAHRNTPELESFFTPWHAAFYTGYLATAAWIFKVSIVASDGRARVSPPPGYGLGLIGLVVFGVGGVSDGFWHTLLGIETSIDALLSPPHLLLFTGTMMVTSCPIRSALARSAADRDLASFLPVVLATSQLLFLWAFILTFLGGFTTPLPGQGLISNNLQSEYVAAAGVGSILVSTIILTVGIAWLTSRWRLPAGAVTITGGLLAVAVTLLDGLAIPAAVLPPLLTSAIVDVWLRPRPDPLVSAVRVGLAFLAGWALFFVLYASLYTLAWPPELWAGSMLLASGLSGVLVYLIHGGGAPAHRERSRAAS